MTDFYSHKNGCFDTSKAALWNAHRFTKKARHFPSPHSSLFPSLPAFISCNFSKYDKKIKVGALEKSRAFFITSNKKNE